MKVKELISMLRLLPQNEDIIITAMDDHFSCTEFEVHSEIEDSAQEIIMNVFVDQYTDDGCKEPATRSYKMNKDIALIIDRPNKRVWVNRITGDIGVGYKYGHGVRVIKYEDLVKLAWVLDYGNEINKLTHVNLPLGYSKEELIKEEKYFKD